MNWQGKEITYKCSFYCFVFERIVIFVLFTDGIMHEEIVFILFSAWMNLCFVERCACFCQYVRFCPSLLHVCFCVCGTDAPGRGPVPCHSETTSQSFLRSKISSPPPFRPLSPPLPLTCAPLVSTSHLQTDRRQLRGGQRSWGGNGWLHESQELLGWKLGKGEKSGYKLIR